MPVITPLAPGTPSAFTASPLSTKTRAFTSAVTTASFACPPSGDSTFGSTLIRPSAGRGMLGATL